MIMETLGGFPNLPALGLRRAKPGFANAIMETLGRVSKPSRTPALGLRLAKPDFTNAIMETLVPRSTRRATCAR